MECPKCGAEIDKNAMVCPNCKKVLKIVCPICRTVNTKNICKKCGEILVTKCENCGKINLMKNQKCVKCGYSTEQSALQAESNAEDFAVIKLEFPNLDLIKATLGSNQIYSKFMANLDNLIYSHTREVGVRRQIIKNHIYLIRFNKAYTLSSSANGAITTIIELANRLTRLNVKLLAKKKVSLKCNFTIMRRFADQDPYDIDTGFKIDVLAQSRENAMRALDAIQIITDDEFYDIYNKSYSMESLDSTLVNGRMRRFYEINIRDLIKIDEYIKELNEENDDGSAGVPNFVQEALDEQDKLGKRTVEELNAVMGEELYSMDLINFDEINCAFYTTENIKAPENIVEVLQAVPKGILAIKASPMYQPYTLRMLATVDELGLYQNIIPITCHDDMKYEPYSFFRELVSSIFEYATAQKLYSSNDFSVFAGSDSKNLIRDLISLRQRDMNNLEDTRYEYFTVFTSLLQSIPDSLIYIENFEKIDSGSRYVLELLFDHFEEMNISYIVSYDKSFSLHKDSHFLLSRPYYTEITLIPTPFDSIIASNEAFYKDIMDDYYFKRISKYAAGSVLFLDYAIQYLVESEVYAYTDYSIEVVTPKTLVIPSSLGQLIQRRLNLLKDDEVTIRFLALCVFLGTRVDMKSVEALNIPDWQEACNKLAQGGFLYIFDDCIYFPNYTLLKEHLLEVLDEEDMKTIASSLLELAYVDNIPSATKAFLYEKLGYHQRIIQEWESLANIDLSMGDFSAYLNCSGQIINCLDKYQSDWTEEELEQYKTSIYENISNNMFEYNPEQTREIADKTLEDLQKSEDSKNFIDLCSKMILGAMDHGEYQYALGLTHKLLSAMAEFSPDPSAPNFSLRFLEMSLIHIKMLFGIGAFKDCVDIGYNILNILDEAKVNSIEYKDNLTKDDMHALIIEAVAYMALADIITLREDVADLLNIAANLFSFIPKEYSIFVQLQKYIKGEDISISDKSKGKNIFSIMLYHIINAYEKYRDNPEAFAKEVYKAKLVAKDSYCHVFEYFTDLLIGYSYVGLKSFYKAESICTKVLTSVRDKGLNSIIFIAWYILSILNMRQGKYDIAYGILNNSTIQMEKFGGVSDYMTLLNKINMYKLLMCIDDTQRAEICMSQAKYIVEKYGLKYDLDIDIDKFKSENQAVEDTAKNTEKASES